MDPTAKLIETKALTKVYRDGNVTALNNVDLTIDTGEFVAIMGPSGSGKSTLLSLLGALDLPTSGEVLFNGVSLTKLGDLDAFRSRTIGFVFQSFYLLPTLTALENVQIPMFESGMTRSQRTDRAAQLLDRVGLSHRVQHTPSRLSIGERQRVAIARALANEPPLLLADEPTGNLDSKTTGEIMDLFTQLHSQQNVTIILITHSSAVAAYAQRTLNVCDGRVTEGVPMSA